MFLRELSVRRKLVDALLVSCVAGLMIGLMSCAGYTTAANPGTGNPGSDPAPAISGVTSSSITSTGATIAWTTNTSSYSQVNYGTSAGYGQSTPMNTSLVTRHSVTLSGLTATTLYHYQVVSRNTSGNQSASADFTFTTTAASAPVISAVAAGSITTSGATITWTTNVAASSQVSYGTTTAYGQSSALNSSLVTSHSVVLSGLAAATLYHFQVFSKDGSGNQSASSDFSFTTNSTNAPVISAVAAGSITTNAATITWTTDVGATSEVNYGTTAAYGQSSALNSSLVTGHSVALSGLTASTTYHFQVVSKGSNGLQATSGDFTFATTSASAPPTISAVTASGITASGATITWTTNVGATSQVNYGTTTSLGQSSALNSTLVTSHSVVLSGLSATTLYYYQAVSKNSGGNQATSGSFTFTTTTPDTTPPSVPTGVTATAISSSQITVRWTASTDNVGVTGYNVFRNGSKVGTSATTTYTDGGLSASTTYSYTVSAFDAAGNTSAKSSSASATTQASSGGGGIPPGLGWYQVPNSTQQPVCPPNNYNAPPYNPYLFSAQCHNAIDAWSGGAFDTSRDRLLIFGGGHGDYEGNEVYAFDLGTLAMVRLDNPSPPNVDTGGQPNAACPTALSDGRPNSRHDYHAVTYDAATDQLWVFGGSLGCASGGGTFDLWSLDLSSVTDSCAPNCTPKWHGPLGQGSVHPTATANLGAVMFYNPKTATLWVNDRAGWYEYTPATDTYVGRQDFPMGLGTSCELDPQDNIVVCMGNDGRSPQSPMIKKMTLTSPYTITDETSTATGCSAILNNASGPDVGMDWDPVAKLFLMWGQQANTDNVYTYNPATNACTTISNYTGGPAVTTLSRGTFGHWRYSPTSQVFVLVPESAQDVFTFRMGTPGPPPAITVSGASCTPNSTSAVCTWTSNVPGSSQVFYGLTSAYGSNSALQDTTTRVTSHSVTISGLAASTTYHFKVQSVDQSNNTAASPDAIFTTTSGSTGNPPVISNVAAVGLTSSSATITWTTDTLSSSAVNYGTTNAYGTTTPTINLNPGILLHSVTISTGLVASTTYHYQVVSTNASSQTSMSGDFTFTTAAQTTSADADFAARCAAPGVFRCYGFDSASDAAKYMHVTATGSPIIDCSVSVSGGCSLKEFYAAQSTQGDSGRFTINFLDDNSMQFGQPGSGVAPNFASGQDFYVQFRMMVDTNMFQNVNWGANANGWKYFIISDGDLSASQCSLTPSACGGSTTYSAPTCSDDEIVMANDYVGSLGNIPIVYHSCGIKNGQYEKLEVFNSPTNPGVYEQQNAIQFPGTPGTTATLSGCAVTGSAGPQPRMAIPPCVGLVPNQWVTVQFHAHVGTWYDNNGVYHHDGIAEAWWAHSGQSSIQWLNFSPTSGDGGGYDYVASDLPSPVPAGWLPQHIYGQISLLTYDTNKDNTITNPVANTWFDELIISTQKIPDPK